MVQHILVILTLWFEKGMTDQVVEVLAKGNDVKAFHGGVIFSEVWSVQVQISAKAFPTHPGRQGAGTSQQQVG